MRKVLLDDLNMINVIIEESLSDLEHKEPKFIACLLLSQLHAIEQHVIAPELPLFLRIAFRGT